MRVLITGGAGFIGASLARAYLAGGADVTVVDSLTTGRAEWVPPAARFYLLDIGDSLLARIFEAEGPFDVVSHHAALKDVRKALLDPRADAETNILGTLNVLRCAADHNTGRFVFPSSAALYGQAAELPTPETAPVMPSSPYGISKAAGEAYCAFFAQHRGLPAVAFRYATVYGPTAAEESEGGVVTIFARRLLNGSRAVVFGDGEQTRDFVHVDDVVRANLSVTAQALPPWRVYNVGTGNNESVNAVYRMLAEYVGCPDPPIYEAPKAGEVRHNALRSDLIRRELGWSPSVALREGLAGVVEAYRGASPAMHVRASS